VAVLRRVMSSSDTSDLSSDAEVLQIMGHSVRESHIRHLLAVYRQEMVERKDWLDLEDDYADYLQTRDYQQDHAVFEPHESPIMRYCYYAMIQREFQIEEVHYYKDSHHQRGYSKLPPQYDTLTLRDNEALTETKAKIPRRATFFCRRLATDQPWILHINTWEDDCSEVSLTTVEEHEEIRNFRERTDRYFAEEGPLKGNCFTPNWSWFNLEEADWSSVVLPSDIKDSLDLNLLTFAKNLDLYSDHNLPTSRGVLLAGEPGTGKTLTMQVLLNEFKDMTRIYAPAETLSENGMIAATYELARKLSPTLVIIEDIDTLGQSEDYHDRSIYVSQLLSSLNSAEENRGVITVASTNYPQALDIALRDRPGRFDARVDFSLPDAEDRQRILEKYASPFKSEGIKWADWAGRTEGYTGAWLREMIVVGFSLAVQEQRADAKSDKAIAVKLKHIKEAYKIVNETRERVNTTRSQAESLGDIYG